MHLYSLYGASWGHWLFQIFYHHTVFGKFHGSPEPTKTSATTLPSLTAPACWPLWMAGSLTTILLMKQMSAMSDLEVVLPTLTVIASPGQLSAPNMVPLLRSWQLILAFPSSLESGGFLQCRASSQCKWYLLKPSGLHFRPNLLILTKYKKVPYTKWSV